MWRHFFSKQVKYYLLFIHGEVNCLEFLNMKIINQMFRYIIWFTFHTNIFTTYFLYLNFSQTKSCIANLNIFIDMYAPKKWIMMMIIYFGSNPRQNIPNCIWWKVQKLMKWWSVRFSTTLFVKWSITLTFNDNAVNAGAFLGYTILTYYKNNKVVT